MRFCLAMALMIGVVAAGTAAAEFYKYIDKQGHVRFTDDINQVPENQRSRVRNYVDSQVPQPPASEPGGSAKQPPEPISAQLEEKEALSKEKETRKTHDEISACNKRVAVACPAKPG